MAFPARRFLVYTLQFWIGFCSVPFFEYFVSDKMHLVFLHVGNAVGIVILTCETIRLGFHLFRMQGNAPWSTIARKALVLCLVSFSVSVASIFASNALLVICSGGFVLSFILLNVVCFGSGALGGIVALNLVFKYIFRSLVLFDGIVFFKIK